MYTCKLKIKSFLNSVSSKILHWLPFNEPVSQQWINCICVYSFATITFLYCSSSYVNWKHLVIHLGCFCWKKHNRQRENYSMHHCVHFWFTSYQLQHPVLYYIPKGSQAFGLIWTRPNTNILFHSCEKVFTPFIFLYIFVTLTSCRSSKNKYILGKDNWNKYKMAFWNNYFIYKGQKAVQTHLIYVKK